MASFYSGYSNYYRLRLDVTQGTQSIANNTTSVSWALYLENSTAYFESQSISGTYVNIDGSRVWTAGTNQISLPGYNSTTKLASGTKTVTHNSDGTKTVPLYVYYTMPSSASYLPGNMLISTSMGLTTIPRASTITLNKTSMEVGDSLGITAGRFYSGFTHTVMVWSNSLAVITLATKSSATSFTWNSANNRAAVLKSMPNTTSSSVTIQIDTYNGSTLIGYVRKTVTVKVPENVRPSIGTLTVKEANSGITSTGYDKFVAGMSHYRITISDHTTEGEGASFVNVRYKLGELSERTSTSASVLYDWSSKQMNPKVTAIITDSRGRTGTKSITITQTDYVKPSISKFAISRYDKNNPEKLLFDLKATGTRLITGGENKNPLRFAIRAKKPKDTTWKALYGFVDTYFDVLNLTASMLEETLTNDGKYTVRVVVQDKLGTTSEFETELNATSRMWAEITNGETINVIGTLQNNGVNIDPTPKDVSNKFTLSSSGATSLHAWQIGKLVFVMFYFMPTEVGHRVAVTTTLPAVTTTALSVAATGSRYDAGKIDAYIAQGEIIGVANEGLAMYTVRISGVYLTS